MFNIASEETYEDGEIIFKEGSSGDWVCVVLSGCVEISRTVGGKKVVIGLIRPDQVFGEHGFIGNIKRTATARAVGKTTVGVIDRTSLDQEFNSLSSEFRSILVAMVQRFQKVLGRATDFQDRKSVHSGRLRTGALFQLSGRRGEGRDEVRTVSGGSTA